MHFFKQSQEKSLEKKIFFKNIFNWKERCECRDEKILANRRKALWLSA